MKKFLLVLLSVFLLSSCGKDDEPIKQVQYVVVLNGVSYNMNEDAYLQLTEYLEFLESYYDSLDSINEQIEQIKILLEELLSQHLYNADDVITLDELKNAIEELANSSGGSESTTPEIPTLDEKDQAPLTVIAYLVADTNIKSDLRNNIKNMFEGLSEMTRKATLLVYWDGGGSDDYFGVSPCIVKYETDGKGNINGIASRDSSYTMRQISSYGEIVKEYPSILSVDKSVMKTILKEMANHSPVDRYGFVAGSHGSGWLNSIYGYKASRSFGQDGAGDYTITTPDMASAMKESGLDFDFLLFDACMMGTAEVCYDFRDVVDYMIVSALDVPAPGFPYHYSLPSLFEGRVDDYVEVCNDYIDYYRTYYGGWGSVALIDCNEMEDLAVETKTQILNFKDEIADYNPIGKLQHYGLNPSATGFKYVSFDMAQFVREMNGGELPEGFSKQLDETILYKNCLENTSRYYIDASNYCGLGMYIPLQSRPNWNVYFETIGWYGAVGWDEITFSWE